MNSDNKQSLRLEIEEEAVGSPVERQVSERRAPPSVDLSQDRFILNEVRMLIVAKTSNLKEDVLAGRSVCNL